MTCIMKVSNIEQYLAFFQRTNIITGEGKFDDDNSNKPSGAATPVSVADGPPSKKKKGISKKAKTMEQRLALADGGF